MRKIALIFFFFSVGFLGYAQNYYISGYITDVYENPIVKTGVFIKNTSFFSYTNDSGYYKILLPRGTFTIVLEKEGFTTYSSKVTLQDRDIQNDFSLKYDKVSEIGSVKLATKKIDLSKEVIRGVVKNKGRFKEVRNYKVNAFIKASMYSQFQKYDSLLSKKVKDTAHIALAQIFLNLDVGVDQKIKEQRLGVKKQGDISSLYWLSATEGWVSVYKNLIKLEGVCDVPVISPISNTGLISYRYTTEDIWFENGKKFYKIGVRPMKLGNALGKGYLIVEDSAYLVHKMVLHFPNMHLPEYNRFALVQHYDYPTDSIAAIVKQEFRYNVKYGQTVNYGRTIVDFDSFQYNQRFTKKHFGPMLSETTQKAYEQDSNFWEEVRTEELTEEEIVFERKLDSIKAYKESLAYKDSMQDVFNKFTLKKLILLGQGHYDHRKERLIYFQPLLFMYTPVMVGGARINTWGSYSKQYKNKTNVSFNPNVSYGIRNKDFKGSIRGRYLFDPIHRKSISASVSRDFEVINPFDAWLNVFRRSNFFESSNLSIRYRQELINGLFASVGTSFSNRRSIANYDFNPLGDSLFIGQGDTNRNTALAFNPYRALFTTASISYTPGQKYMREPFQKIILGSKWPTFGIKYRKGTPGVLNSEIDFDFIEFDVTQQLKLGLLGRMNYRLNTGKFIQMRDLRPVDYVFQPNSNPYLFSNPNYNFQRLDSVYKTFNWFYEGHLLHRFNGAILNKIPLLKKMQMVETMGGGFLISPENNLRYVEAFVGIEKMIKVLQERFRLGIYLVGAQSNRFEAPLRLKFSIEYYNRQDNSWMF